MFDQANDHHSSLDAWYEDEFPEVSIIVLNHNRSDLTADCLSAIWRNTFGHKYEVIVVDNGSEQAQLAQLQQTGSNFRLISLPQNRPFGEANNIAVASTTASIVVFVNNDTLVQENWLRPLISLLGSSDRIGAVGPRMLFPDGWLQEAGAYINENGVSMQVGTTEPYHPEEAETARPVDYCSAACLVVRRTVFNAIGGFDPLFAPAYFEDADLCFRMTLLGFHVYYCPSSTIIHIGGETSRTVWDSERIAKIFDTNRRRFLYRWGARLRSRASGDDSVVLCRIC